MSGTWHKESLGINKSSRGSSMDLSNVQYMQGPLCAVFSHAFYFYTVSPIIWRFRWPDVTLLVREGLELTLRLVVFEYSAHSTVSVAITSKKGNESLWEHIWNADSRPHHPSVLDAEDLGWGSKMHVFNKSTRWPAGYTSSNTVLECWANWNEEEYLAPKKDTQVQKPKRGFNQSLVSSVFRDESDFDWVSRPFHMG